MWCQLRSTDDETLWALIAYGPVSPWNERIWQWSAILPRWNGLGAASVEFYEHKPTVGDVSIFCRRWSGDTEEERPPFPSISQYLIIDGQDGLFARNADIEADVWERCIGPLSELRDTSSNPGPDGTPESW